MLIKLNNGFDNLLNFINQSFDDVDCKKGKLVSYRSVLVSLDRFGKHIISLFPMYIGSELTDFTSARFGTGLIKH